MIVLPSSFEGGELIGDRQLHYDVRVRQLHGSAHSRPQRSGGDDRPVGKDPGLTHLDGKNAVIIADREASP